MGRSSGQETPDEKSARRIAAIQQWLVSKAMELRRVGFYGELTARLKFEDGRCVLGEQQLTEKTK